jgi:RNA polymerase sigma-70 factor (family 1)
MTVTYDEVQALKLLSKGSEKGFTAIYNRYAPGVAHFALRLLKSRELAQDVVQEVFSKIWVEHERFAAVDDFESYLFICVRNRASDLLKKRTREELSKAEYLAQKKVGENSVDDYMQDRELSTYINQAIDELPTQMKRVYLMMADERLSQKDIAAQLNISPVTVKDHIYSARVFIRKKIEKHIVATAYAGISALMLTEVLN